MPSITLRARLAEKNLDRDYTPSLFKRACLNCGSLAFFMESGAQQGISFGMALKLRSKAKSSSKRH